MVFTVYNKPYMTPFFGHSRIFSIMCKSGVSLLLIHAMYDAIRDQSGPVTVAVDRIVVNTPECISDTVSLSYSIGLQ